MGEINEYRKDLKRRIVEYAMAEFYKRGVRAVKMDEISQGLHVSKRTVYEIFGDKEELLLEGLKEGSKQHRACLERYALNKSHNVIDIIAYFYKMQMEVNGKVGVTFYEEIHKMPRILQYLAEQHENENEQRVKFFELGVKEGLLRGDMDYKMLLELLHISMEEIMHRQLYKQYTMQQIFDNFFLVIIRGFCTERGLRMLDQAIGG